ncbi:hypothetical protein EG346_03735 [Chryseobacterium carnipullorum]|uniref:Uncharacterized protein n=1 Tax=Chryseobacterium carnipullorum TaxID=1124835 RepID=A0A376EKS9_CHRCU|nr:hypothetical protein [Chryseobacterium carnipullorum]AZA47348.1 hypothetical protein EG346_03735 [Chryseobacterium carnipullorum]AZA66690.1 hypothetical protein EG345_19845 [Chryseobacterium carnipullorum]STD09592.1 Uncharacterised protein [Chryseobacterium carnipullorum]HBV14976.1 hypothetical protein [Chryseobacterium carnipullorum]
MKTLINDSIGDLETALKNNTQLREDFMADPVGALKNIETQNPKDTDSWIYRIIVFMLGLAVIIIVVGLIVLSMNGRTLETQLITIFTAISSGAIGALAGLLAPSSKK